MFISAQMVHKFTGGGGGYEGIQQGNSRVVENLKGRRRGTGVL